MDFRQKFFLFILLITVFAALKVNVVNARRRGDIIILGQMGGGHHHHHKDHKEHQSHQQTHIVPVPIYMPYHCNCGHETSYSSWGDLNGYKK